MVTTKGADLLGCADDGNRVGDEGLHSVGQHDATLIKHKFQLHAPRLQQAGDRRGTKAPTHFLVMAKSQVHGSVRLMPAIQPPQQESSDRCCYHFHMSANACGHISAAIMSR